MSALDPGDASKRYRLLIMTQGQWGERIADNISQTCPDSWEVHRWAAPRFLPPIIDDPDDFLPAELPSADLLLALGDMPGAAQLIPDVAKLAAVQSVLAPIDRNESLPRGLARQVEGWLKPHGIGVVFPRPFCSLTETTYNRPPIMATYDDPLVSEFARYFGAPRFDIDVGAEGLITMAQVVRDSACGCARAVAEGLVGCAVDQAPHEAGMLHHHYPCLASMNQDPDYCDTLMHISGHALRDAVQEQVQEHLSPTQYFRPTGRVDDDPELPQQAQSAK